MTIYKPKPADRKGDVKKSPSKDVAVSQDTKPLATKVPVAVGTIDTVRVIQRRRRSVLLLSCCIITVLAVLLIAAVGSYFLYYRLSRKPLYSHQHEETAKFHYYELQKSDGRRLDLGYFTEKVEIDDDFLHERLDVPPILESRKSTIIHDFEKNLTAIVDRDSRRCYVMPLNRTAVQPPRNFFDLLVKYKSNYYLPDAEVVRDNYRIQVPPVDDVERFGFFIWSDCRMFDTYRLVPDSGPRMMSKRSACELAGDTYCLGGASASSSRMLCLKLTSCT